MPTDTKAMGLLLRMLPLMRREFGRGIDTTTFFADPTYANAVIHEALEAKEPRLRNYARDLLDRLIELGAGPPGAVRSRPRAAGPDSVPPADAGGKPGSEGPASRLPGEGPASQLPGDDPNQPPGKRYLKTLR